MNKKHFILYIILACLLTSEKTATTQNIKQVESKVDSNKTVNSNITKRTGQLIISVGIGYSPGFDGDLSLDIGGGTSFPIGGSYPFGPSDNDVWHGSDIIPELGIMADYCLNNSISLGLAISYQSENIEQTFLPTPFNSDFVSRLNIAGRLLYYLNKREIDKYDNYLHIAAA